MSKITNLLKKSFYNDAIRVKENSIFQDFRRYHIIMEGDRHLELHRRCLSAKCPCCGGSFRSKQIGSDMTEDCMVLWVQQLYECKECGFWKRHMQDHAGSQDYVLPFTQALPSAKSVSLSHLAKEIESKKESLYSMSPYKFEQFIGSILGDFYDCEVNYIGQTNDDGIDLILLMSEEPTLVQVKRRASPLTTEGVNVVKHFFASMYGTNASKGILVSTAQKFSKTAMGWLEKNDVKRANISIDLVDMNRLLEIITSVNKTNKLSGWDYFDKDKTQKIFSPSYTKTAAATFDFVEIIGLDGNKYYYIPSDSYGFYKLNNATIEVGNSSDVKENCSRINGAAFFRNTRNLNKNIMFPIARNWAIANKAILFEDNSNGDPIQEKFNLFPGEG
ncbi:hypothetical protein GFS24_26315 [Chitinophaga sp. SYP-B3965]|uniref:restriction endonuclease n=1 Tax=Chitinophaga sp. SYP-B3965 TaxID=2663120 RepID=UPI0012998871|nr:restriction endonuclease [Chitinophaga sp. SYP-B3965]MRG48657.1 hypothetical protein [Chitinophaga sp. SYP-B3965]